MAEVEAVIPVQGSPCVVLDKVTMTYQVPSTEAVKPATESRGGLLRRRFGSTSHLVTVHALNDLSLVVERGESLGIIGRNGSGKSTLMKLISGQIRPQKGTVLASSTPVLLGVNAALVPELSGDQNIILGCMAMGLTRQEIDAKFNQILELSGLEDSIHLPMRSYSSGMSSRLRFAIAASLDPEILLVDEALNTGDAQFRDKSKARMDELRAQAGCVFLVSHSLSTIKASCTRVIWLDRGDLIMDGDPEAVVKEYQRFTANLVKGNNGTAGRIRAQARAQLTATRVLQHESGRRRSQP
jgi:teichoic acid transport system ATP-binding protein